MKELSLNILDIAENSLKAGASLTEITITEAGNLLTLTIKDNGCGMTDEVEKNVLNPFYTTRTTRKVGMGIPLLMLAAEQTGGSLSISSLTEEESPLSHGTTVIAKFYKDHLDFTPLGDVISTITTLIQGHPLVDFLFLHRTERGEVKLDTRELREMLEDIPLDSYEIIKWIEGYLKEQYELV